MDKTLVSRKHLLDHLLVLFLAHLRPRFRPWALGRYPEGKQLRSCHGHGPGVTNSDGCDSLPEIAVDFDDSNFTIADQTSTNVRSKKAHRRFSVLTRILRCSTRICHHLWMAQFYIRNNTGTHPSKVLFNCGH